jgi:hypothetical protein
MEFQWSQPMSRKTIASHALLIFLIAVVCLGFPRAAAPQKPATDVRGTWSGSFQSDHSNMDPFTMTVVINPDSNGHLVGTSDLVSECVRGIKLQVTVNSGNVILAGSDSEGDSVTLRGTMDTSGTLLKLRYIVNGSASGRCETDQGSGTLGKR